MNIPKNLQKIILCYVAFIVTVGNLKQILHITKFCMVLQILGGIQQDSQ